MSENTANPFAAGRVVSLDVMRGLIMFLLCAESCLLYVAFKGLHPAQPAAMLMEQFFHHPWHGLRFWDLVQPAFMFMAGAAMYISYSRKLEKGSSWQKNWGHIGFRSLKLFLFGLALHCVYAGKPVWELWNVLTQLAFTTLVAYLMIGKSYTWQITCSLGILLLTEMMYLLILMPGFDQPFTEGHNFGAYADTLLMGKINSDGWVAVNAIPTAAHTIWGVLAGKLLISAHSASYKIKMLMGFGLLSLLVGLGLDVAQVTPIIKRISTSSFVFASGGWVLIMVAITYWLVDVKKYVKYTWVFSVMGMNAIFIYIFFETLGMQWLNGTVGIFTSSILGTFFGIPANVGAVVAALSTLFIEWGLCYWLYKRNIFFKL
jgi:predicted acyltransferase